MGTYRFEEVSEGCYKLYENEVLLACFTRLNLREKLGMIGRSSNWIGSMIRLLDKAYPYVAKRTRSIENRLEIAGERKIVDYLKERGLRVFKDAPLPMFEMVEYLERRGYKIEGIIEGSYYSTSEVKVEG